MTIIRPAEVFPPGEYLRDELEERGWTVTEFAQILGRPIQAVSEILNGKKEITTETAVDIAAALGTSPEVWLNLQNAYRLHHVRPETPELSPVARRGRLRRFGPTTEMRRRGWLPDTDDLDLLEASVEHLFEIDCLDDTPSYAFAARRSNPDEQTTSAQVAWLAYIRKVSTQRPAAPLDLTRLATLAADIPRGLRDGPSAMKGLAGALAECGIVLVIEPCLKGSKIDGAACFNSNGTAVIGLTARYDRFDILLFTLLHELAHLTHQHVTVDTTPLVDDDVTDTDAALPLVEQEANDQAATWLFPRGFEAPTPPVSVATIGQIAAHHSVHPSVVIGRLQRDGVLDWSQLRTHIPKVRPYLPWIDL